MGAKERKVKKKPKEKKWFDCPTCKQDGTVLLSRRYERREMPPDAYFICYGCPAVIETMPVDMTAGTEDIYKQWLAMKRGHYIPKPVPQHPSNDKDEPTASGKEEKDDGHDSIPMEIAPPMTLAPTSNSSEKDKEDRLPTGSTGDDAPTLQPNEDLDEDSMTAAPSSNDEGKGDELPPSPKGNDTLNEEKNDGYDSKAPSSNENVKVNDTAPPTSNRADSDIDIDKDEAKAPASKMQRKIEKVALGNDYSATETGEARFPLKKRMRLDDEGGPSRKKRKSSISS